MARVVRGLCVAAIALLCAGCLRGQRGNQTAQPGEWAPVPVSVRNNSWNQVTIFALAGGTYTRLGQVSAAGSGELLLPASLAQRWDLRLLVDPLASRAAFFTDILVLTPGARIELAVENQLALSTWSIR